MEQNKNVINVENEQNEQEVEATSTKKPKTLWVKKRHSMANGFLKFILAPYTRFVYGYRYEKFKDTKNQPYLILSNYQTAYDPVLIAKAICKPTYFISDEHIFSKGILSKMAKYFLAPIPTKNNVIDMNTINTCSQIQKEGGSIVMFPEISATFSGETGYIDPSIVGVVRALKMPLALFKIHGGYGVYPRWAKKRRFGKMFGHVKLTLSYDEYKDMPDQDLYNLIKDTLYVDESINQLHYKGRKKAEYLDSLLYVCPHCGVTELKSDGNYFGCEKCGMKLVYTETGDFLSATPNKAPFNTVKDWFNYQRKYMFNFDVNHFTNVPIFIDDISLIEEIPFEKKETVFANGKLSIYSDRIEVVGIVKTNEGETEELIKFNINEILGIKIQGRNNLVVYIGDKEYMIKGKNKNFNAVKYVDFCCLVRNN